MFIYDKGFTHAGSFHADDVFSTAFLKILNPNIKITRGFAVPTNYDGIVYDIGGGEFDHHSIDRECRESGVMYAAFGKLWRKYADLIVSPYVKDAVDKELISYLDESDNTGKRNLLSSVIYNYNGYWDEDQSLRAQNKRFFEREVQNKLPISRIMLSQTNLFVKENMAFQCTFHGNCVFKENVYALQHPDSEDNSCRIRF